MHRDLDIGMRCIKYMLFVSNLLFCLLGFLMISIGTSISSIYGDFESFMESHHFSPSALVVAIGVITFFVAALGFIGAIRESTMLVNLYSVFLAMILILEISAAIAAYTMRVGIVQKIDDNMVESLYEYGHVDTASDSWDFAQSRLQCCGVHGYKDWKNFQNFNGANVTIGETFKVPYSCCVSDSCKVIYERGCLYSLTYIISECAFMLGSAAVSVGFVQILGIVFANVLAKAIRKAKVAMMLKQEQCRQYIYDEFVSTATDEKRKPVVYMPVSTTA